MKGETLLVRKFRIRGCTLPLYMASSERLVKLVAYTSHGVQCASCKRLRLSSTDLWATFRVVSLSLSCSTVVFDSSIRLQSCSTPVGFVDKALRVPSVCHSFATFCHSLPGSPLQPALSYFLEVSIGKHSCAKKW